MFARKLIDPNLQPHGLISQWQISHILDPTLLMLAFTGF
jgi:hypothetical protein